jgi:hypothetical protein
VILLTIFTRSTDPTWVSKRSDLVSQKAKVSLLPNGSKSLRVVWCFGFFDDPSSCRFRVPNTFPSRGSWIIYPDPTPRVCPLLLLNVVSRKPELAQLATAADTTDDNKLSNLTAHCCFYASVCSWCCIGVASFTRIQILGGAVDYTDTDRRILGATYCTVWATAEDPDPSYKSTPTSTLRMATLAT